MNGTEEESGYLNVTAPEVAHRLGHTASSINHEDHHHGFAQFLLITVLVASQVGLYRWKQWHPKSYNQITLLGLWGFPAALSLYKSWWRFLFVWAIYSLGTLWHIRLAKGAPLLKSTPRRIYSWFLWCHTIFHFLVMFGYMTFVLELMGLAALLPLALLPVPLLFLSYGLYFSVLSRDCAEWTADTMSTTLGLGKKDEDSRVHRFPANVCALCGNDLRSPEDGGTEAEQLFRLPCGHTFHEFCIRGWVIVGKKDTCPFCSDKVPLEELVGKSPWKPENPLWTSLLDALRYFLVYHPVVILFVNYIFSTSGLMLD